jgi:hypothetical protein
MSNWIEDWARLLLKQEGCALVLVSLSLEGIRVVIYSFGFLSTPL